MQKRWLYDGANNSTSKAISLVINFVYLLACYAANAYIASYQMWQNGMQVVYFFLHNLVSIWYLMLCIDCYVFRQGHMGHSLSWAASREWCWLLQYERRPFNCNIWGTLTQLPGRSGHQRTISEQDEICNSGCSNWIASLMWLMP